MSRRQGQSRATDTRLVKAIVAIKRRGRGTHWAPRELLKELAAANDAPERRASFEGWREAKRRHRRARKRAVAKLGQPFRKDMHRKRNRRRAAGKNNVRPNRGARK